MKRIIRVFLVASFVLAAGWVEAAPIVFSGFDNGANSNDSRPNADAAAAGFDIAAGLPGGMSLVTFESAPIGSFNNLAVATGVTIDGTDQLGDDQTIRNAPFFTPDALFGFNTTAGGSRFAFLYGGDLLFTFATPINAFGAYFAGLQTPNFLIFNDGTPQAVPIPFDRLAGGVAFVGFTNVTPFSTLRVTTDSDLISIDDARFGSGSAAPTVVPEPATVTLLGTALAILAARRRRPAPPR